MDKIGDFFDEIKPMVEVRDFDRENGAVMFLGADFENECAIYQGKMKCLVAMIVSAMERDDAIAHVLLKSAEVFLAEKEEEKQNRSKPLSCSCEMV